MARGWPLESSASIVELNMVVRTVIMSLIEEIDPRPPSLGVVVLALGVRIVQILRLVRFLLSAGRTLPLLKLHVLVLCRRLLIVDQIPRPLPRVLDSNKNHDRIKLTSASQRARPRHQRLSVNR